MLGGARGGKVDAFGFGAGHASGCEVDGFLSGVARGMRVSLRERFGFQTEVVVQLMSAAHGLVEVFFRSRVVGEGFHEVVHECGVVLGFLVLFVHNYLWFVSKSDNTGGGRIVQRGSEQSVGAVRFQCIIKMYLRMDKNLRKERMEALKRRLYSGIPADAGFNVNQLLIVQGLLFDAVDEAVSEYERWLEEVADDGHKVVSYL